MWASPWFEGAISPVPAPLVETNFGCTQRSKVLSKRDNYGSAYRCRYLWTFCLCIYVYVQHTCIIHFHSRFLTQPAGNDRVRGASKTTTHAARPLRPSDGHGRRHLCSVRTPGRSLSLPRIAHCTTYTHAVARECKV